LGTWIAELDQLKQLGWTRAADFEAVAQASTVALEASRAYANQVQAEIRELQQSLGYRVLKVISRMRLDVAPKGSRRDRFLWLALVGLAGLRRGPFGPYRAIQQARQQSAARTVASPSAPLPSAQADSDDA
jgi:hypothetical protein